MLCFALNVKVGILNIDPYVKVVLTVIAVCLVVIAFKPVFVTEAEAQGQVVDVRIVGIDEAQHLRWESIPVKVKDWNVTKAFTSVSLWKIIEESIRTQNSYVNIAICSDICVIPVAPPRNKHPLYNSYPTEGMNCGNYLFFLWEAQDFDLLVADLLHRFPAAVFAVHLTFLAAFFFTTYLTSPFLKTY